MSDLKERLHAILARATEPGTDMAPCIAELLVEHSPHPTLLLDVDGTVLFANAASEDLLGRSNERGIGRSLRDLVPPAEGDQLAAELAAWHAGGATGVLRCEHSLDSDTGRMIAWSMRALHDPRREGPIAVVAAAQDVTERAELARNLARTSGLYQAMLETATDPIVLIDARGIVFAASRSCEAMFGWPRSGLIGQNVSVLMTEPHRSEHDDYLRRYLATGRSTVLGKLREFVVCRRDGGLITVELSAFRLDIPGYDQPVFCGFFRDISERKRLQEREATHLAALGAIAESASMLAHELKNPITGLRHALRAVGDHLGASEQEIIGELADRMQRLERRLRRTLQFVRSPDLQRERCDARKLVRDVAGDLRQLAEAKRATIDVESGPAVYAEIDAPLMQDVLANLLTNALEAVPKDGLVRVGLTARAGDLEIRVDDNGPGVPASVRDRLFHPFITSKASGTGLGLMICKRIVEAHGGAICVGSSELGGATFLVKLPEGT